MTFLNQPPLTPGFTNYTGLMGGSYAPTKNPFYSVANQFLPRNLHDVIRWVRFITINSPLTTEVMRKLSTYPITKFNYDIRDPSLKEKYESISRSLKLKSTLHDIGYQYHTIGNVFVSINFPIIRSYKCKSCESLFSATNSAFLKFKNYEMVGECPKCKNSGSFERKDLKSNNIEDINIIIWDPLNIVVHHNPITGKNQYYYNISNEIKRRIISGDRFLLDSIPWEFVDAVRESKQFLFSPDRIFHLKNMDIGLFIGGCALPPLVSHFSFVFYTATLRKANESIATDFMAPMRIVFPQPQTANSDPVVSISMRNFTNRMEEAFIKHKLDNNHVVIAPVPIGYQAVSGEGKSLLISQEIAQAEETLLLSMGVSRELLSGTTNWTSSAVGLRMLKNSLDSYVGQIEDLLDWIFAKISNYLNLDNKKVSLVPFQLTDDELLKNILASLVQTKGMSMTTLYNSLGKDYAAELEIMTQEAKLQARQQVRTQFEVDQATYLEGLEINKEMKDSSYTDILAECQNIATQLINAGNADTQSILNGLKVSDYAKYLMVSKLLEEGRKAQTVETNQEIANQAMTDPESPNAPKGPNEPTQQ